MYVWRVNYFPSLQQQLSMSESKNEVQYNDCIFCDQEDGGGLFFMMNDALKVKYAENPKDLSTNYIDSLLRLQRPTNSTEAIAACKYRQYLALDDKDEFLKREYEILEYGGKITQLTQYYKFHSDIPKIIELGVEKIMGKYYDKKRECDYKRIKKVLKQEQGLSITSVQESDSCISDSQIVKKSKYSTLLNGLSQTNRNDLSDSQLLFDFCKQIDKAIPSGKGKNQYNFKGSFSGEERMFEYYLKSEEQKSKQKLRQRNKVRQGGNKVLNKFNYQQFLKSRQKITDESKETKMPKQQKKTEKDNKFVYNTNIKIEIRNAMFYSEGQPAQQMANLDYENKVDNRFKKKNIISSSNMNQYRSNQKLAAQIYKSSQRDLRLKNYNPLTNQRMPTKENITLSRSKENRKSYSKQNNKKTLHAQSARKLIFNNNEWILSRQPIRSLSTSSIKKRSVSTHGATASSSNSAKKLQKGLIEKRPIESISRYGSSQYKGVGGVSGSVETKTISIKDLLSRKLKFKIQ